MSGSQSRPRKIELTLTYSKNRDNYCEYFTHNTKPVLVAMKTNLMAVIFIS